MDSESRPVTEPEDHPVDNAPVRSLSHDGLTIQGYSRAVVQTYWRIPELNLGFDLGGQPWSFAATPNWFVSHAHLDHLAALPTYVARRRMMRMAPPTIYLPSGSVGGVQALLEAVGRLDGESMPARLVGLEPGREVELSRDHVVTTFATRHTLPSLGFVAWERRGKLRPKFLDLSDDEIRELRSSGVQIAEETRRPRVAYLGDTSPAGLDAVPEVYTAQILILEVTFVAPWERPADIHKYGHTHLDDILVRADRFENEVIIAGHFSTRLPPDRIRRLIERRLPARLRGRLVVWL